MLIIPTQRTTALLNAGDVIILDFPGVQGIKRRPAVGLSSDLYHSARPDVIAGLITSQTSSAIGPTDYALQDWATAGLRVPSAFRAFVVTVPRPPARHGTHRETQ